VRLIEQVTDGSEKSRIYTSGADAYYFASKTRFVIVCQSNETYVFRCGVIIIGITKYADRLTVHHDEKEWNIEWKLGP
jgi:hypothetical protein